MAIDQVDRTVVTTELREPRDRLAQAPDPLTMHRVIQRPTIAGRVSQALRTARTGARETTGALQVLPDTTLMGVAAGSLGVGAGFYLARAPRLAIAAGIAPALLMLAAIVLRPIRSRDA